MADEMIQVTDFRRIVADVDEFVNFSKSINDLLGTMSAMVKKSFELELELIIMGLSTARPSDTEFSHLARPLSDSLVAIQDFRNKNRNSAEYFNHLSTISESIAALGWISVKPAPTQFVRDLMDSSNYYANRVLSANKGDPKHTGFVSKYNNILQSLEEYVKNHHRTGFEWGIANKFPAGGRQQPPPPPPPPPPICADASGESGSGGSMPSALLQELNQGVDITRRLKHVGKGGSAGGDTPSPVAVPAGVASQRPKPKAAPEQPPKFILDGRKWRVEHQKNVYDLVIESDDMSQSISVFKNENMGLTVKSKMNGISIDNTKKSTVVLSDVISSLELIRCSSVKVVCNGVVPLISVDNCDCIQIFLTERSIGTEVISSKSTSSNICLLKPDGDYAEHPVPEQIKTTVSGNKLHSTVLETI